MGKKLRWPLMLLVIVLGAAGVLLMGVETYQGAPPIPDFRSQDGKIVASREAILRGQGVFQKYALMDYGSFFGDGAGRGMDYTADALHQTALAMTVAYQNQGLEPAAAAARAQQDLHHNTYQPSTDSVILSDVHGQAFRALQQRYLAIFQGQHPEAFRPSGYLTDSQEIGDLSAFFFWGGWVCAVDRPGYDYSYTHNWPYDPEAGNRPSPAVLIWSIFGSLALLGGLGIVLYLRGRFEKDTGLHAETSVITEAALQRYVPSPTQRATYKFFVAAILLFLLQVVAGILTVHDFVGFTTFWGVDISHYLPITIVRSWHVQIALLWISACWIGSSIFILPMITRQEPSGQGRLIETLFWLLVVIVGGSAAGIFLGPKGWLGSYWNLLGNQGWEFLEMGKLWQAGLFLAFALWGWIVFRGVRPALEFKDPFSLPAWLNYSIISVLLLFCCGFVAGPRTNFVIADFWRWCVIHMWVEAFFEVFTTVLVGYFLVFMGLVSRKSASQVVFFASVLFLGSGILGISHNFYWNAKPIMTLALGSVFSTLQVVPLILLSLEAWRFRKMPREAARAAGVHPYPVFGQEDTFRFLLAVNFWNFLGAGVFGFIINLPIANYYEHGTYLTVNHGHAALMGVYGNLSLAALLYCLRYLLPTERWNSGLLQSAFWSINLGLALSVVLDLFPAGILQLDATVRYGLWYSRSQEFILGQAFQMLTWMRLLGGAIFVLGGVVPLVWFVCSRIGWLKTASTDWSENGPLGS